MSTSCVTPCRSTVWTTAASTSGPPAVRSTARPTAGTAGHRSCRTCRQCCRSRPKPFRENGAAVTAVRVVLPGHLRTLAHVGAEVSLDVAEPLKLGAVVEAGGHAYPMLRRTTGDQATGKRRSYVPYFACMKAMSHAPPYTPLHVKVVSGAETFM